MSQSKTFKFTWVPNSKSVTKNDLPKNELDQKPGYIDQNSISNLVKDFKNSEAYKELKDYLKSDEYKAECKGKPQQYNQMPKLERIPIIYLFTALAVQRKIDWDHLVRIVTTWDSRRPATVNVIRLPGTNTYYITDGQHTVMAIAIRAMLGLFDDVDKAKWEDVLVNCQVVETSDFSFAREHFLGINGADKLPILPFDIHKIHVFGNRLDNSSQEKYVMATRKQKAFEEFNLTPVHPESIERFKPGSVVHANLIKKLEVDDIKFFGENHNTYWPQEPLDSIEMLPFQDLRKRLIKEGADFNAPEFKEFMRDLNALVKEVAGGWAEFKNLTQKLYPAYYKKAFKDDAKGCPADASLVLLMQLYKKAGGTYQYVPNSLITRYREKKTEMFNQLDSAKKELFK